MGGMGAPARAEHPVPGNSPPARPWLPVLYDRVGLTQEQEQQLKTIYWESQHKIDRLNAEIARLQQERRQAAEQVLTDDQMNRLHQVQDEIRAKARQRQQVRDQVPSR
jgi:hypothetical protein